MKICQNIKEKQGIFSNNSITLLWKFHRERVELELETMQCNANYLFIIKTKSALTAGQCGVCVMSVERIRRWPAKSRWVSYFYIIAWNKCWFCTDITSYKSPMPREPVLNFSQQRETRKNQRLGGGGGVGLKKKSMEKTEMPLPRAVWPFPIGRPANAMNLKLGARKWDISK